MKVMKILCLAVLLVMVLGVNSLLSSQDPPETPTELKLSVEDMVEFSKQLILLQQVQNLALVKRNVSLGAAMEASNLDKQAEILSVQFQKFLAQHRPRADCSEMPSLEGKWNCPVVSTPVTSVTPATLNN